MTDTVRTLSALQALLADNVTRAISPQDIRDAVISGVGHAYGRAVSGNTTLTSDDVVVAATGGSSGITLTLPPVASNQYMLLFVIKVDSATGAVTLDANSTEQINGAATYTLSSQWAAALLWCDGTQWFVLATA